ncbi:GGDEF domain-containing protein [Virgibacillus salinus]|uniref:Diguanylate cyclase (GGDEF) domain-containing protein n=1 Tax=Virgibacillus salinus TaxID=553311 RepID=A0A1H1DSU7_9BACI|nr:GGDEF domain-containing protein [Virgibacillus salinus]SDQ79591.1 diguanylate cyclase (GGDEF) domain-containing protein [Virgibacillus salinus]
MNYSSLKDEYYPLLLSVISAIVEEHHDEMKTIDEFNLYFQNNPNYLNELADTFTRHCEAFFLPEVEYQNFIKASNTTAFKLGIAFAETNYFTVELILQLTHSTRMCCIRHMLNALNEFKIQPNTSMIIERFFELTNTRQNSFSEGYIYKQNDMLKNQSITDPLTGLYNRRYFYKCIVKEMTKAYRTCHPITLMLIDLNNLKEINDEYGHNEGDKLLEHFAQSVTKVRSNFDSVFRFGGDEFVIIAPNCNEENAEEIGMRLNSEISKFNSKVSLSYGIINLPLVEQPEKLNIEHYLKIADDRMYKYKAQYKNTVVN